MSQRLTHDAAVAMAHALLDKVKHCLREEDWRLPAIAAWEGAAEVARKTNWTIVFLAVIAALTFLAGARRRLFPSAVAAVLTAGKRLLARVTPSATASPSPERKEEVRGRS